MEVQLKFANQMNIPETLVMSITWKIQIINL